MKYKEQLQEEKEQRLVAESKAHQEEAKRLDAENNALEAENKSQKKSIIISVAIIFIIALLAFHTSERNRFIESNRLLEQSNSARTAGDKQSAMILALQAWEVAPKIIREVAETAEANLRSYIFDDHNYSKPIAALQTPVVFSGDKHRLLRINSAKKQLDVFNAIDFSKIFSIPWHYEIPSVVAVDSCINHVAMISYDSLRIMDTRSQSIILSTPFGGKRPTSRILPDLIPSRTFVPKSQIKTG